MFYSDPLTEKKSYSRTHTHSILVVEHTKLGENYLLLSKF